MKTLFKSTALVFAAFLMISGNVFAQEVLADQNLPAQGKNIAGLSDQQNDMLKQRKEKQQDFRKEFQSSISQDQRDILDNPRVVPAERNKQFRLSLTDSQVELIKAHKAEMRTMREDFQASLTPEQKQSMKNNAMVKRNNRGAGMRQGNMQRPPCPCGRGGGPGMNGNGGGGNFSVK